MQSLGLDEDDPIEVSKGFWARQFHEESTASQRKFDWAFGVVIPALCFYFDPIVFRGNNFGVAVSVSYT
ncbi:MAG: hypothetical protein QUS14_12930, partial [Pyrinomonadaceae bacterium]|nr:hypothetical protein [Pyrinomonadaceae bacterium]